MIKEVLYGQKQRHGDYFVVMNHNRVLPDLGTEWGDHGVYLYIAYNRRIDVKDYLLT